MCHHGGRHAFRAAPADSKLLDRGWLFKLPNCAAVRPFETAAVLS